MKGTRRKLKQASIRQRRRRRKFAGVLDGMLGRGVEVAPLAGTNAEFDSADGLDERRRLM
jgi:hypothetical protein